MNPAFRSLSRAATRAVLFCVLSAFIGSDATGAGQAAGAVGETVQLSVDASRSGSKMNPKL